MISFTHGSEHRAGQLLNTTVPSRAERFKRASAPYTALALVLCCLAGLFAYPNPCRAQNPEDTPDNQTLTVTFISLKPGSTIGASNLQLHADGTLDFSIDGEALPDSRGTWSQQKHRFAATIDFTVDKRTSFHYRLIFDGYSLMGAHAGRAQLWEYDRNGRRMQNLGFLFYAVPPDFFTAQQRAEKEGVQ